MSADTDRLVTKTLDTLFSDTSIGQIIEIIAERPFYSDFFQPWAERKNEIESICCCCLEAMTGHSHFFIWTILNILKCLKKVKQRRLGSGSNLNDFRSGFKGTVLEHEPYFLLYNLKEKEKISENFEIELRAAIEILNLVSSQHVDVKNDRTHPYKLYWYLVGHKDIDVDYDIASRFHPPQSLIRLIILFLLKYHNDSILDFYTTPGSKSKKIEKIVSYYNTVSAKVPSNIRVLPRPINYEFDKTFNLIEGFLGRFVEYSKPKKESEKQDAYERLSVFSNSILRQISEYRSAEMMNKTELVIETLSKFQISLIESIEDREYVYDIFRSWTQKTELFLDFRSSITTSVSSSSALKQA